MAIKGEYIFNSGWLTCMKVCRESWGAIKCVRLGDSSKSCLRILVSLPRLYQIVKQSITLKTVGPNGISIKLGQDAYVRRYTPTTTTTPSKMPTPTTRACYSHHCSKWSRGSLVILMSCKALTDSWNWLLNLEILELGASYKNSPAEASG